MGITTPSITKETNGGCNSSRLQVAGSPCTRLNELAAKKFGPDPFDGEGLFSSAEDFDGNQYILLCPFYPWGEGWDWLCSLTVRFPNLNAEIDALYQEAINAVAIEGTKNVRIDYYDVQNGG